MLYLVENNLYNKGNICDDDVRFFCDKIFVFN